MRPHWNLLSKESIDKIILDARVVLERVGVGIEDPEILEILSGHGARIDAGGTRAFILGDLVDRCLGTAPSRVVLYDRDLNEAARLEGDMCHFVPGSAALRLHDPEEGIREGRRSDLDRLATLVESTEVFPVQSTSLVPADVPKEVADRVRLFHALKGSRKPIVTGTFSEDGFDPMVRMLEAVRGDMERLRKYPFAVFDCCPTPPLQWSRLTSDVLVRCARLGIPATLIPMPLAGATGPATLHGCLVQIAAEALSGIVIHQCAGPGSPVIWGGCPTSFDMRHGTTPTGAPETVLLNAASMELARHIGLPGHGYLGLSDATMPDMQAGFETCLGAMSAVLSGMNLAAGAGLLRFVGCLSLEKLLFDAEICKAAHRFGRGIDIHDDEDKVALFSEAVSGKGFLGLKHTRRHYRQELTMPGPLVDRTGGEVISDAFDRCGDEVDRILASSDPVPFSAEANHALDEILEAEFKPYL
jgi:trimethylamine--corrinoid protein Co-methyltransferase